MDITSNTLEDDKDCRPTGHDRQETEYHVASMAEGLAPTTAEGSEEPRCCDDEEFKVSLCRVGRGNDKIVSIIILSLAGIWFYTSQHITHFYILV